VVVAAVDQDEISSAVPHACAAPTGTAAKPPADDHDSAVSAGRGAQPTLHHQAVNPRSPQTSCA